MPASIVQWPVGVPSCFMPDNVQGGPRNNRYSFETDSESVPIERPRYSWATEVYDVELTPLSNSQFILFRAWFRDDLKHGTRPFAHDHPVTGIPSAWRIVSSDPAYQVQRSRMPDAYSRGIRVSFKVQSMPFDVADVLSDFGGLLVVVPDAASIPVPPDPSKVYLVIP